MIRLLPRLRSRSVASATSHFGSLPALRVCQRCERRQRGQAAAGEHRDQRRQETRDLAALQAQPVVGHRARDGHRRLDHVEAAHLPARLAARRELARQPRLFVALAQEVGVQRQDHVGRRGLVARNQRLAERELRPFDGAVVGQRRIADELRARESLEDPAAQVSQERRRRRRDQEAQAGAAVLGEAVRAHRGLRQERPPRQRAGARADLLGAIVVIDAQGEALLERRRRAQRLRVGGVAFDLRGAALVALDQQAAGVAVEPVRRREVQRVARRHLFGAAHERDDLLGRLAAGRADGGDRGRQAGHLHEAAARDAIALAVGPDVERAARELVGGARDRGRPVAILGARPVLRRRRFTGDRERAPLRAVLASCLVVVVAAHDGIICGTSCSSCACGRCS